MYKPFGPRCQTRDDVNTRTIRSTLYGLFTFPDTDLDSDPGTDIHPQNGYSKNQGSGSESESELMQWEQVAIGLESESESVSGNVNKPFQPSLFDYNRYVVSNHPRLNELDGGERFYST